MKKIFFCAILCALVFTSCGGSKKTTYDFTGKAISPTEIGGVAITEESTEKPVKILFREGNAIGGCLGCNYIAGGSYYINEDTITFSEFGITRAMCDENTNKIERQMVELLSNTNVYTVEDDIVSFYKDNSLLGKFKFVDVPEACCGGQGEHQCQHGDGEHQCQHGDGEHQCQHGDGEHQCQHGDGEHQCQNAAKAQECANAEVKENAPEVKTATKKVDPTMVKQETSSKEPKANIQGPSSVKESATQTKKSADVKSGKTVNATKTLNTPEK